MFAKRVCLVIVFGLSLVGCVGVNNFEKKLKGNDFDYETFNYVGCQPELLPVSRAVAMRVSETFWSESDAKVLNSLSKDEWRNIILLLSRIPTDCVHEKGRIIETAYHIIYNKERMPIGVSVSLFLGEEVILRRDKTGQWKIINVLTR